MLFRIPSTAQTSVIDFRDETLASALIKVSDQFHIKVAFDAKKAGSVQINKLVTGNTPEELLQSLLSGLQFEYLFRHNRYLIIDKPDTVDEDSVSCQILGTIVDKESGEQLPYAIVVFPELNLNTYASSTGSFSFKNIKANPFRLTIHFIGYNPVDTLIRWNHSNLNCNFQLKRKIQVIDTVIVNSPKLEMINFRNDVDFATTVNTAKLIDLPILAETDIFRTLQLLPGISYSENSSELSIHGGSSDQNLILFDGQTLYNLSHYYGVISSLNPNVIKDIQVFKGGYDSRYGERVSGIVDITAKSGNQVKPKVYGDINLVSGNLTAELPLTKKLTLVAAYRRSYSDIYATEFANSLFTKKAIHLLNDSNNDASISSPSFHFYDYNAKLTYRRNTKESVAISVYGGKDFFSNPYKQSINGLIVENTDKNNWSNYGISTSWSKQWNTSLFSNLQFGASGYSNNYKNNTLIGLSSSTFDNHQALPDSVNIFEANNKNTLNDISLSLKNSYTANARHTLYFGALLKQNSIYYHKDADKIYVYDNIDQTNWISSLYFLDKIKLNEGLTFKPGVRVNYYDGTKKIYIEPRAALGIEISKKANLRMALGRYCQYISQVGAEQETGYIKNFWLLADGSSHPVLTSNHYIVGLNIILGNFLFDAEAYYKQLSGIQEYFFISNIRKNSDFEKYFPPEKIEPAPNPSPSFFLIGNGKAYGIDFLIQYNRQHFTGWLSYSLSRSLQSYSAINNGSDIPAPEDQLHQLSLTNMFSAGKWNFGAITLFASGRPYSFFSVNLADGSISRSYKYLSNYFRMDLSSNYAFKIGSSQIKIGASLINILNSQNFLDINSRDINFETSSFSQTNLIRSKARSLNLFLHFSF